jgi:hypothetical protein
VPEYRKAQFAALQHQLLVSSVVFWVCPVTGLRYSPLSWGIMYKGCEKLLISCMFELSVRNGAHEMELRLYVEFTLVGMLFSIAAQMEFIALYIA